MKEGKRFPFDAIEFQGSQGIDPEDSLPDSDESVGVRRPVKDYSQRAKFSDGESPLESSSFAQEQRLF